MAEAVTAGGHIVKMEVDYMPTCDEKIPQCQALAAEGKLQEALDILLALEKQTRTGADMHSTSRVLVTIVQLCFEAKKYELLNEQIVLLSKRRSQLKQAVTKMVQEACTYVDKMPDKETQLKLIDTLRTVTAGKIYVEVERARLTHKLAIMKESEGDITEAATILQELQVETFGSMDRKEKVELILEQMRLCIAKKDYIRTQIISKKINVKFFDEEGTEELKLKYYRLMIEVDQHEGSYMSICKHYRAIYNTPGIKNDIEQRRLVLKNIVLYLLLSPYDNEQADLTHRICEDKQLEETPLYKDLLELFMTSELIKWLGMCETFERELRKGSDGSPPTDVFLDSPEGNKRWKDLQNRVVEHNIRVMAKYYTKIRVQRMSELLALPIEETEEFLSNLVVKGMVSAKMDRLEGIISFSPPRPTNEVLNDWATSAASLMQLVNKTTHLIHKEEMGSPVVHFCPTKENILSAMATKEWKLGDTAPFDPRFPNQNQTKYCYQSFVDFHRCQKIKGEGYEPCQYFKKVYKSICPHSWVEKWENQLAENRFPGKI
ncbi:unnamed protein product [Darwinula stevensoni]|uniref:Cytochrome c oxidase subunit 6B1 n=1 Tax=Darwinula stevensoni TaxID=69355 RepID=A0A7R9AFI6_9CRUS|nr:unnamed protein product [Darwinula stevensoni]CAG0902441.1 unnamed protein product [Darwinula stevensoni]